MPLYRVLSLFRRLVYLWAVPPRNSLGRLLSLPYMHTIILQAGCGLDLNVSTRVHQLENLLHSWCSVFGISGV